MRCNIGIKFLFVLFVLLGSFTANASVIYRLHSNTMQTGLPIKAGDLSDELNQLINSANLQDTSINNLNAYVPGYITPVGSVIMWPSSLASAPNGYINMDGGTIGDASSGATSLSGTNAQALFLLLWSNAYITVQNNAGTAVSKGVSAAADWGSHDRLVLPNMQSQLPIGASGGVNSQPSGLTARSIGVGGGSETHMQTINEMPQHNHSLPSGVATANGTTTFNSSGSVSAVNSITYSNLTSNNTGGNAAMNIMNPFFPVFFLIKY